MILNKASFNAQSFLNELYDAYETVLLKTNLVACHDIERRVTTDPNVVKAVAEILAHVYKLKNKKVARSAA